MRMQSFGPHTHLHHPGIRSLVFAVDESGFIKVNDSLQSVSHHDVFAAGDIAMVTNFPRPKSGVFAVRQGLPLYKNLKLSLTKKVLKKHVPQISFFKLN